jgi:hypothetical protein
LGECRRSGDEQKNRAAGKQPQIRSSTKALTLRIGRESQRMRFSEYRGLDVTCACCDLREEFKRGHA